METKSSKPSSVDEYIAQYPPDVQTIMNQVRSVIKEAAPAAKERISYGMPGFYLNGMLVWFGGHKNHIGFYPTGEGIEVFKNDLARYKTSKGAVQFPLDEPMPYDLIKKIVRYRLEVNLKKR